MSFFQFVEWLFHREIDTNQVDRRKERSRRIAL